ncbi:hypothetical protein HHI36_014551 [Cryptolaemus montrouzieri]|uniref:Lipase n=1 Tax=Cryptolaemus montrouzieri TaxID=559131 RepID=A0ABD2N3K7_9CUCU
MWKVVSTSREGFSSSMLGDDEFDVTEKLNRFFIDSVDELASSIPAPLGSSADVHMGSDDCIETELIQKYGYPSEIHEVTTEDEYILTLYRIPHGRQGSGINSKPILLMHGLFGQAENYVVSGMFNGSLAYLLADNGFDVWLGNTRGNMHCRRHKRLDPNTKSFWNFSWHEMGMFDLPASIDYVLEKTKTLKLYYIGHSQGGTIFYIMSSLKPNYQKKIILASLLAPAGYFNNFNHPFIDPIIKFVKNMYQVLIDTMYEFPPKSMGLTNLVTNVCEGISFRDLCARVYNMLIGDSSDRVKKDLLPLVLKNLPTVSIKQPLHYGQVRMSGHFRPWDYGKQKNFEIYGTEEPPDYPIKSIKVPIAIYHSVGDNMVNPKDIENICNDLPNCVRRFLVEKPSFNHADFIYDGTDQLNIPILEFMKNFNGS